VGQLTSVLRFDPWEFGLAVVTLLTVAFVGVEQGIGVAVGLAILDRTRRSARPHSYVLGKIPGTTSWEPLSHHSRPVTVPGVVVVQWLAPVYFANAAVFHAEIHKALSAATTPPAVLILDADAITDIDYTGARTVRVLVDELHQSHIVVGVARAVGGAPQNLARSGLLERIGPNRIFSTVDEAVNALHPDATA
jgi:MFS superfamily sulfate permease-like transporter